MTYALLRHKPLKSLLFSGFIVNGVTQPLLWIWLASFYWVYPTALLTGEAVICLGEAILLKQITTNQLQWRESFALSLMMNSLSFSVGLLIAV